MTLPEVWYAVQVGDRERGTCVLAAMFENVEAAAIYTRELLLRADAWQKAWEAYNIDAKVRNPEDLSNAHKRFLSWSSAEMASFAWQEDLDEAELDFCEIVRMRRRPEGPSDMEPPAPNRSAAMFTCPHMFAVNNGAMTVADEVARSVRTAAEILERAKEGEKEAAGK